MDSPLARIQLPRRGKQSNPVSPVPKIIKLPDGREFNTQELLHSTHSKQNYNLRSANPTVPTNAKKTEKYTHKEKIWIAQAQPHEISERYQIKLPSAVVLRNKCRSYHLTQKRLGRE